MRAAGRQMPAAAAGEPGSDARGEQPRQKYVHAELPRRVKEILEEHLHFQKEECSVKHPAAEALEEVWNVKNNFSIRSLKPVSQNRSDLLLQPQFYSRHARTKSRIRPYIINVTGQGLDLECLAENLQAMEMKTRLDKDFSKVTYQC